MVACLIYDIHHLIGIVNITHGDRTGSGEHSVRKELKIRPGFTPQEDVGRFKTSRKQTAEMNALPKGHIVGWVPPSSSSQSKSQVGSSGGGSGSGGGGGGGAKVPTTDANGQPLSKAALKNAKRKAKKIAEKANAAAAGGGSTSVSRAEDSDEEGGGPVVVAVDDAPDTWDDEGDEEAPARGTLSLRGDASAKESQTCTNSGVDTVADGLEKLAVSE